MLIRKSIFHSLIPNISLDRTIWTKRNLQFPLQLSSPLNPSKFGILILCITLHIVLNDWSALNISLGGKWHGGTRIHSRGTVSSRLSSSYSPLNPLTPLPFVVRTDIRRQVEKRVLMQNGTAAAESKRVAVARDQPDDHIWVDFEASSVWSTLLTGCV